MVDGQQHLQERLFDLLEVPEGQVRVVQLPVLDACPEDLLDQRFQPLVRGFFERPTGGLHRVGQHENSRFLGVRFGAGITELRVRQVRVARLLHGLPVEVLDPGGAMVHGDEIQHFLGQPVLAADLQSFFHMAGDDQRAHARLEVLVRIHARPLVFHEVLGLDHLADVVIEGPDAHQQRMGSDGRRGRFGQIGHLERVVEGARRPQAQLLEQRPVGVRQLQQRQIGGDVEGPLEDPEQRIGHQHQHRVDAHQQQVRQKAPAGGRMPEGRSAQYHQIAQKDQPGAQEKLAAVFDVAHAEDAERSGKDRSKHELEIVTEQVSADEGQRDRSEERHARVENNRQQNRGDGHGHGIHGQRGQPHGNGVKAQDGRKDQGDQQHLRVVVEDGPPEQEQIQEEEQIGRQRHERLAEQASPEQGRAAAFLLGALERGQLALDLFGHDLAALYDHLAGLHQSVGGRNARLLLLPGVQRFGAQINIRGHQNRPVKSQRDAGQLGAVVELLQEILAGGAVGFVQPENAIDRKHAFGSFHFVAHNDFVGQHAVARHVEQPELKHLHAERPGFLQRPHVKRLLAAPAHHLARLVNGGQIIFGQQAPLLRCQLDAGITPELHIAERVVPRGILSSPQQIPAIAGIGLKDCLQLHAHGVAVGLHATHRIGHLPEVRRRLQDHLATLLLQLLGILVEGKIEGGDQIVVLPDLADAYGELIDALTWKGDQRQHDQSEPDRRFDHPLPPTLPTGLLLAATFQLLADRSGRSPPPLESFPDAHRRCRVWLNERRYLCPRCGKDPSSRVSSAPSSVYHGQARLRRPSEATRAASGFSAKSR